MGGGGSKDPTTPVEIALRVICGLGVLISFSGLCWLAFCDLELIWPEQKTNNTVVPNPPTAKARKDDLKPNPLTAKARKDDLKPLPPPRQSCVAPTLTAWVQKDDLKPCDTTALGGPSPGPKSARGDKRR